MTMTKRKRTIRQPHIRRTAAERRRIGREYARAALKGLGAKVLEKYGISYGQAIAWSKGKSLGTVGVRNRSAADSAQEG